MQAVQSTKILENFYVARGFRPWALDEIERFLKEYGYPVKTFLSYFREVAVKRAGELVVALTKIERALPDLCVEAKEALWSRPMWADEFSNLVTTAGLNDSLDKHLKGSAYTAAWYVLLTDGTPTPAAGDTMASHAGWTEVTAYDEATRAALTLGSVSAGSVDNSANKAQFTIDTNGTTIGGAGITSDDTPGATDGILYGVGAFSAGDKVLDDDDTLDVTITCTAAAA